MPEHPYLPVAMPLLAIEDHTATDRTFRFECRLAPQPGQFMEISLPGTGEAPFSISGVGDDWVDLTIRRVGCLTERLFALSVGETVWGRGPYGHGFELATSDRSKIWSATNCSHGWTITTVKSRSSTNSSRVFRQIFRKPMR